MGKACCQELVDVAGNPELTIESPVVQGAQAERISSGDGLPQARVPDHKGIVSSQAPAQRGPPPEIGFSDRPPRRGVRIERQRATQLPEIVEPSFEGDEQL